MRRVDVQVIVFDRRGKSWFLLMRS
jgi:hypothetical protein